MVYLLRRFVGFWKGGRNIWGFGLEWVGGRWTWITPFQAIKSMLLKLTSIAALLSSTQFLAATKVAFNLTVVVANTAKGGADANALPSIILSNDSRRSISTTGCGWYFESEEDVFSEELTGSAQSGFVEVVVEWAFVFFGFDSYEDIGECVGKLLINLGWNEHEEKGEWMFLIRLTADVG